MSKTITFSIARVGGVTFELQPDGVLVLRAGGYLLTPEGETWPRGIDGWAGISEATAQATHAALSALMMEVIGLQLDLQSGDGVVMIGDARTFRQSQPDETPVWVKP